MITIIVSTNRSGSYSRRMADLVFKRLSLRNIESGILDLQSLPVDFPYQKMEGKALPEFDQEVASKIQNVEKFIFIIPEYNGSFPGILKTFIDSVPPRFFYHKKAALIGISSGKSGALRALDHFTGVMHYLQVEVLSDKPRFPQIELLLHPSGELQDEESSARLERNLDKFLRF